MLDNQPNQTEETLLAPINSRSLTEEIVERITKAIEAEKLKPGQKLPSEPNFAKQLNVSRNTLREAINILAQNDLLYRKRGVGTFVSNKRSLKLVADMEIIVSTTDVIKNQGCEPGVSEFSYEVISPSKQVADKLNINQEEEVLLISRTRTADGVPVTRSNEHIPGHIAELLYDQIPKISLEENWSLYQLLKSIGVELSYVVSKVRPIIAEGDLAEKIDVEDGEPLLCFEQTHFGANRDEPVLYCINYHNHRIIDALFIRKV